MTTSRVRRALRYLLPVLHQTGKGAAISALPMMVLPARVAEQSVSPFDWSLRADPRGSAEARPGQVSGYAYRSTTSKSSYARP
jgi:hypothetical protein